jgi:integrase
MGTKWFTGGVSAAPRDRIQFDFVFEGVRYRPTIKRPPSEANLRRARERLQSIKQQIELGTFLFAEEFPDYRHIRRLGGRSIIRTCDEVFDEFLAHCESRRARDDMAAVTVMSYQKVLNTVWRPHLGKLMFRHIRYSSLVRIADGKGWSKKTYNNNISVLRRAFVFGYRDHPALFNPALGMQSARLKKKDRPEIDPFAIQDAETLIEAIHREHGEPQGNYDEFRFFTGLRPCEEIALSVTDIDLKHRVVSVNKSRVAGILRLSTKTGDDRRVFLCPRAMTVLKRQLQMRAQLQGAGRINHDYVFFQANGAALINLQYPQVRWRQTLESLPLRYRRPYCARHSSVSWNLMVGRNVLWVAKQHGHSIHTMLRVYAAWTEGTRLGDIKAIRRAMNHRPERLLNTVSRNNALAEAGGVRVGLH